MQIAFSLLSNSIWRTSKDTREKTVKAWSVIKFQTITDSCFLTESWSYAEWEKKIQNAFEEKFWIAEEPNLEIEGDDMGWVHKRGIYKDCYKATDRFADFQLRPNFPMAMAVVCTLLSIVFMNH